MGGRQHRLKALSAAPCRVLTQRPAVRGSWRSRVPRPTRLWAVSASPGPAPGCVGLRRGLGRCPPRSSFTSKPEGTRPGPQAQFPVSPRSQSSFPQPATASAHLFFCNRLLTSISAFAGTQSSKKKKKGRRHFVKVTNRDETFFYFFRQLPTPLVSHPSGCTQAPQRSPGARVFPWQHPDPIL